MGATSQTWNEVDPSSLLGYSRALFFPNLPFSCHSPLHDSSPVSGVLENMPGGILVLRPTSVDGYEQRSKPRESI